MFASTVYFTATCLSITAQTVNRFTTGNTLMISLIEGLRSGSVRLSNLDLIQLIRREADYLTVRQFPERQP